MKGAVCKNCTLADKAVPTGLRIHSPDTTPHAYTGIEQLNKCMLGCGPRILDVGAGFYTEVAGWGGGGCSDTEFSSPNPSCEVDWIVLKFLLL